MKANTLIVDDEKMARSELIYLLDKDDRFQVKDEAENGKKAISLLKNNDYQLIFLDIKMPGFSGMEIARLLKEFRNPPEIVFTTAYDEYAVEAFKLAAIDYLLKPISEDRFEETLDRVWSRLNQKEKGNNTTNKLEDFLEAFQSNNEDNTLCKIPVEENERYRLLDYSEIYYFSTADNKVKVHTEKESYLTNLNLKELEKRLPSDFFRIHRSYIVNLNKIKEVIPWFKGKYQIVLADSVEHEIPVSRTKVDKLNKLLNLK
ncbi:MAG: LytR/AlgR family response regulator transcription factor [Bacillota bacterium]